MPAEDRCLVTAALARLRSGWGFVTRRSEMHRRDDLIFHMREIRIGYVWLVVCDVAIQGILIIDDVAIDPAVDRAESVQASLARRWTGQRLLAPLRHMRNRLAVL